MAAAKPKIGDPYSPLVPHPFDPADAAAFQALQRGTASPEQQKRALTWLVACSGYYDLSYRPGAGGDRDTSFAEGKRWVGAQLVKLINVKIGLLPRREAL